MAVLADTQLACTAYPVFEQSDITATVVVNMHPANACPLPVLYWPPVQYPSPATLCRHRCVHCPVYTDRFRQDVYIATTPMSPVEWSCLMLENNIFITPQPHYGRSMQQERPHKWGLRWMADTKLVDYWRGFRIIINSIPDLLHGGGENRRRYVRNARLCTNKCSLYKWLADWFVVH